MPFGSTGQCHLDWLTAKRGLFLITAIKVSLSPHAARRFAVFKPVRLGRRNQMENMQIIKQRLIMA